MPSICLVFKAAVCALKLPNGTICIPALPHPCWSDNSPAAHSVRDPLVDMLTLLPFKSSTVLIGPSFKTTKAKSSGASDMAAMAFSGAPLNKNPSSGPAPRPMSTLSAVKAWCNWALPLKTVFWISKSCALQAPILTATSKGMKEYVG